VHPIRFPEGADRLPAGPFGLVHVDVDLHRPTLASLEYFAERTVPGSVIVVDDFGAPKCPGVARAVDEFLAQRPPFAVWEVDTEQLVLVRR
jgi:O-methyltransferase